MKQISAKEFLEMIEENPSVFEHWNTPLEITEYVDCSWYKITHLSTHLTFSGRNEDGAVAHFGNCHNLKIATGTFDGYVRFAESGVQKIENLNILKTDITKNAASFWKCNNLTIATGTYPGWVNFSESGIHSIHNLHIHTSIETYASFECCPFLKTLEGWDLSKKIIIEEEKLEAEIKRRASLQKYIQESQPIKLPFL
jgi:hypothetical protein